MVVNTHTTNLSAPERLRHAVRKCAYAVRTCAHAVRKLGSNRRRWRELAGLPILRAEPRHALCGRGGAARLAVSVAEGRVAGEYKGWSAREGT